MSRPLILRPGGPLHLFQGIGIEIEYMLVRRGDLAVLPATDRLLAAVAGEIVSDVEVGQLCWSNELVLHVVELKTNGPAAPLGPEVLDGLLAVFQRDVRRINELLEPLGGRLMPTAMHPWMDPETETRLWPHEYSAVYETYNRIFDCRGHGWSNLQSLHLNLPFAMTGQPEEPDADEGEFGRLHAAIRLLLPLLPALAASSPLVEGRFTGILDNRMEFYRGNSRRIPSVAGLIVPEPVFSRAGYRREIYEPMMREIAPQDPDGVLEEHFLNSRGAIARFDRGAIEIRVIDVQECPRADLALAYLVQGVLELLVAERWSPLARQQAWPAEPLAALLRRTTAEGDEALIDDADYLAAFGVTEGRGVRAGDLWRHLLGAVLASEAPPGDAWRATLEAMVASGPLARRIQRALGPQPSRDELHHVYSALCDCLERGELFGV